MLADSKLAPDAVADFAVNFVRVRSPMFAKILMP
jgi:hypothetical protein